MPLQLEINQYNDIQYVISENMEMVVIIRPEEKDFSLKLLAGDATGYFDKPIGIPVGQNFRIPVWCSFYFVVKTTNGCSLLLKGNHTIRRLSKRNNIRSCFFDCNVTHDNFSIYFTSKMQVQVSVSEDASEFSVGIRSHSGKPGVLGYKLRKKDWCSLFPGTTTLVNSLNKNNCGVDVLGSPLRIKISFKDKAYWKSARSVYRQLREARLQADKEGRAGPTVLVVGPPNTGKSCFCHLLLNKALDEKMNPIYVDLDVYKNSVALPGCITFCKIADRRTCTIGFTCLTQNILFLGDASLTRNNIQFYYYLTTRMSVLLKQHQRLNIRRSSGIVMNTCGSLGKNTPAIEHIVNAFDVDFVVVMGDESYYRTLKYSILKTVASAFIPSPGDVEPRESNKEIQMFNCRIQRYFFGIETAFNVSFDDIRICRFINNSSKRDKTGKRIDNLNIVFVQCDTSIEKNIFAVSAATTLDGRLPLTEVQYFVCFDKVDVQNRRLSVLSHFETDLSGKILIQSSFRGPKSILNI